MLSKILNILSITLLAFVVSYLVASVFDRFGLQTNTMTHSILIIAATLLIVAAIIVVTTFIMSYVTARQTTNYKK